MLFEKKNDIIKKRVRGGLIATTYTKHIYKTLTKNTYTKEKREKKVCADGLL